METPTKKTRSLPHVWSTFWHLANGTKFYIDKKTLAVKTSFLTAETHDRPLFLVWPFRRVKTTVLIRDVKPGGKSSLPLDQSEVEERPQHCLPSIGSGICAPSHLNCEAKPFVQPPQAFQRVEQPHSDNGISGPTS